MGKCVCLLEKPWEGKNRRKRSEVIYIDLRSGKRYSCLKNANCENRVIRKMCVCLNLPYAEKNLPREIHLIVIFRFLRKINMA